MILRARLWFVILAAAEAVIAILVYGDAHSTVRVVAVLFFLLICPGMAWIRLLQLYEPVTELTLAIALSVAGSGGTGTRWPPNGPAPGKPPPK